VHPLLAPTAASRNRPCPVDAARTVPGMSASRSEPALDAAALAARREAVASVRAEGLEPGPECLEMLEAIAQGRMTTEEARQRMLARYRT
jgi:Antitoxin VbhA